MVAVHFLDVLLLHKSIDASLSDCRLATGNLRSPKVLPPHRLEVIVVPIGREQRSLTLEASTL